MTVVLLWFRQNAARRSRLPAVWPRGAWAQQRRVVPIAAATCRISMQQSVWRSRPVAVVTRMHLRTRTGLWDA